MMVSSLSDLIYLPADFIVCSGDTGRELFFMRRGVAGGETGQKRPLKA